MEKYLMIMRKINQFPIDKDLPNSRVQCLKKLLEKSRNDEANRKMVNYEFNRKIVLGDKK
jgi:hypothetical protein